MCPASYPTLGFSSCQLSSAGPVFSSTETYHRSCTWTELPCQTIWRCFDNHQVSCLTDLMEGVVSKLRSAMPEKPPVLEKVSRVAQALSRFVTALQHCEATPLLLAFFQAHNVQPGKLRCSTKSCRWLYVWTSFLNELRACLSLSKELFS